MQLEQMLWVLASGLATGVGGLFLLVTGRPSDRLLDGLTGFTAGVMLAATNFSLLVPALDRGPLWSVAVGLLGGGVLFALLDRIMPHIHLRFTERGHQAVPHARALLTLSALTLHNVPEGMAVGVAFAAGGPELGIPIALAIGVQNVPEGFAAAAPLTETSGRRTAAGVAALTGIVEPPAALLAFATASVTSFLLAPALAFAAGAMLYVIVDELIPESEVRGNERLATLALMVGFTMMLVLDNAFG